MKSKGIVLIGPTSFAKFDKTPIHIIKKAGYEVRLNPFSKKMSEPELIQELQGVNGVIAGLEPFNKKVLEQSSLKVISRCGVGIENVDLATAKKLGIQVFATPEAPTNAVAEFSIGAIFCMLRKISQMNEATHQGKWEKMSGPELRGKTVSIIGVGRIGRQVAEYLNLFGARVLGVDVDPKRGLEGIEHVSLERAIAESHIICLHASGSQEILGPDHFKKMRNGVYITNTGRGGLINEEALQTALDNGLVAGAWLDTFSEEPYFGPLKKYPQVLLTPHVAYSSNESRKRMETEAVENLLSVLI